MKRITLFFLLLLPNLVQASLIVQSAALDSPITSELVQELCTDMDEDGDLFGSCSTSFDYGDGRTVEAFASSDAIRGEFKNSMVVSSTNPPGDFLSGAWGFSNAGASLDLVVEEAGIIEFIMGYDGLITTDTESFSWSVLTNLFIYEQGPEPDSELITIHEEQRQAVSDLSSFFFFNAPPEDQAIFSGPSPTTIEDMFTVRLHLDVGNYLVSNQTLLEGRVSDGTLDMDFTNTSELLIRPITASFSFSDPLILSEPALRPIPEPSSVFTFLFGLVVLLLATSRRSRSEEDSVEGHFRA